MRLHVLVNGAAGSVVEDDQTVADIEAAFASVGGEHTDGVEAGESPAAGSSAGEQGRRPVEVTVEVVNPADMGALITRAWSRDRPDAVVIAGGDGTVNAAAGAAADCGAVLSVLPLGTFNHFARDLGIPVDLTEAAQAIATGSVRAIDLGEVNGRVFVNNSVLGAYPMMVEARERLQDVKGWGKFRALPVAVVHVARNLPVHRLDLFGSDGYTRRKVRTPFVFVGNGLFENEPGTVMARTSMNDGVLGVSVARVVSRWGMLRAGFGTLVRGADQARDLDHVQVAELTVRSSRKSVRVAFDGEVEKMAFPLRYRCRPGALKVLAPAVDEPTVGHEAVND